MSPLNRTRFLDVRKDSMSRLLCTIAAAFATAASAHAAAPPAKPRLLTLREAYSMALQSLSMEGAGRSDDPEPPACDALRRDCLAGRLSHERRLVVLRRLHDAERAYWHLAAARLALDVARSGEGLATDLVRQSRFIPAGRRTAADFYQARGNLAMASARRREAAQAVARHERSLREVLGLAVGGPKLVPTDAPAVCWHPRKEEWMQIRDEAIAELPELALARARVEAAWKRGGPALAVAKLELDDLERKATARLLGEFAALSTAVERAKAARARSEAFDEQFRARHAEFTAGRGTLDMLLESHRFWVESLTQTNHREAECEAAWAAFDLARGAGLRRAYLSGSRNPLRPPKGER